MWLGLQNDLAIRGIDLLTISTSPTLSEFNNANERSSGIPEDKPIAEIRQSEEQESSSLGIEVPSAENLSSTLPVPDAELCEQLCEAADAIIAKTEAMIQKNTNPEMSEPEKSSEGVNTIPETSEPEKSCEVTVEQLCDAADDVIARSEALVLKSKTDLDPKMPQGLTSDVTTKTQQDEEDASSVFCRSELFVRREDQNLECVRAQLAQIDATVSSQDCQTQTVHVEPESQSLDRHRRSNEPDLPPINRPANRHSDNITEVASIFQTSPCRTDRIHSEVSESSEDVFHDCEDVPLFEEVKGSTSLKTEIASTSEIVSDDNNETSDSSSDVSGFRPSVGLIRIDSPMPSLESRYSNTSASS